MRPSATEQDLHGVMEYKVSCLIPLEEALLLRQFATGKRVYDTTTGEHLQALDVGAYYRSGADFEHKVQSFARFIDHIDGFHLTTRGAHTLDELYMSASFVNQFASNGDPVRIAKVVAAMKPKLEDMLGNLGLVAPPEGTVNDLFKFDTNEVIYA